MPIKKTTIWKDAVISWKHPNSWFPIMDTWLKDFIDIESIDCITPNQIEEASGLEKFEMLIKNNYTGIDDIIDLLATDIQYAFVRAYHGCRTESITQYIENGIIPLTNNEINKRVKTVLSLADLSGSVNIDHSELPIYYDSQRIYTALDDRHLCQYAGQYLVYGSEYLIAVFKDHKDLLKKIGIPTIIKLDIPLRIVCPGELNQLIKAMFKEWLFIKILASETPMIDFSITIQKKLDPSYIVGHYHPNEIFDPYLKKNYRPNKTECSHCAII